VLSNSLADTDDPRAAYRPWSLPGAPGTTLFFRDEHLSDLIGFEYAKWHGRDAAHHLVGQLEDILAASQPNETPIVSIIMDGENAWEHYPYNGYYFFEDLYILLENHPKIRTTTYSELLSRRDLPTRTPLPRLVAGSWVYGSLSTWIGDAEKNRAWDLLCAAKQSYDLIAACGRLTPEELAVAEKQLSICESSDWFWWFGDYNPALTVASFDQLFRRNLANLYQLIRLAPPAQLNQPISRGSQSATGGTGTMRRAQDPNS
jgi:alpha-amylase/alpha-mannosidase (GH57 family)